MIEIDLYTLAKEAPEQFNGFWDELKKELKLGEEHKELFKTVFCHGYCKALDGIVGIIEKDTIKPIGEC